MLYVRPKAPSMVIRTSIYDQVHSAIAFSRNLCRPSLIVGPPGIGKTTALAHIADQDYRAIYLTLLNSQKTLKKALLAVGQACSLPTAYYEQNSVEDIHSVVFREAESAARNGKYLIIDEAQRADLDARMELLGLWEYCGLPVIFCGNPQTLKRTKAKAAAFDQLQSRFGKIVDLKQPIDQDFIEFGIAANVSGNDAYKALVSYGKRTTMREVGTLLEAARSIAKPGSPIALDNITDAAIHIRGLKEAKKLLAV